MLQFPLSALLAVCFALLVFLLAYYKGDSKLCSFLASRTAGVVSLSIVAVFMMVEGTWSPDIVHTVWFYLAVLLLLLCLESAIIQGVRRHLKLPFLLNHIGLFLVVWASFFGAPDLTKAQLPVGKDAPSDVAFTADGYRVPLPFKLSLKDFEIEYYADGCSPKQYKSLLLVDGKPMETSVNHPCHYKGYALFQQGYDTLNQEYSIILVSKDPWLPVVYLGMIVLAAGAVLLLAGRYKLKVVVPVACALALVFGFATLSKIRFGTLMPALRSLWFVPHLIIYMLAYSILALALLLALGKPFLRRFDAQKYEGLFVRISSALLIVGMLCGAVWARQAWGDYWAWDPKECWAAATWLLTLCYLHLTKRGMKTVLVLAFLALQLTWYGVNYLPSASDSLHTYNTTQSL